ncbi:MAG: oxidative damage protection protein [Pseudomonadales bacterium]|nr:oxidative damage protection protein [Pseudomonadales bacterium]
MTRTVFCRKYQRKLEGLEQAPYPGPKGEEIFEHVSKQAWLEWQQQQTMLINEKHLNMRHAQARQFLQAEMEKFLAGEEFEQAEGYVPVEPGSQRDD